MHKRPLPMLRYVENPGDGGGTPPETPPAGGEPAKTFTQDEVNALVGQARTDERRKAASKFSDYDDLKAKADGAKTLEDRMAEVEQRAAKAEVAALRSRIAADHGISTKAGPNGEPSDADLFLTGSDETTLTAQAQRLAQREVDRKKAGNVAPRVDGNPNPDDSKSTMRDFTRQLFKNAAAD